MYQNFFLLFIFSLLMCFFNIFNFLFDTVYCAPHDKDDIIIPGSLVREFKRVLPGVAWIVKDIGIVGSVGVYTKKLTFSLRISSVIAVYTSAKLFETGMHCIKNYNKINDLAKSKAKNSSGTNIPSVIEPHSDSMSGVFENMSDIQTIATCCAGLIGVCIMLFTFLTLWVLGREYADKAKSIIANYRILNKIFLFYLRYGDLASIPARVFFVCFIYVNLSLSFYFLTFIPLFLQLE